MDIIDNEVQDVDSTTKEEIDRLFEKKYTKSEQTKITTGSEVFTHISLNSDELLAAAGDNYGNLAVVDVGSFQKVNTFHSHTASISGLRFFPNNPNLLLSADKACKIRLHDMRSGKAEQKFSYTDGPQRAKELSCLDINCVGEYFCAGTSSSSNGEANIIFWDVRAKDIMGGYSEGHSEDITSVKYHPNRRELLCSAAIDDLLNFYDTSKETETLAFQNCINFEDHSPDVVCWDQLEKSWSKVFAINSSLHAQYWDMDGTKPEVNLQRKKFCRRIKRSQPSQCYILSLDFDSESNPLFSISSNLSETNQENACIRNLMFDRESKKIKPHSEIKIPLFQKVDVIESVYLKKSDSFLHLEPSCVKLYSVSGNKRTNEEDSVENVEKKMKHEL